jgi:hypothetical protein
MPTHKSPGLAGLFGCRATIILVCVITTVLAACDHREERAEAELARKKEEEFQRKLAAIPDPFRAGAIIYTYNAEDQSRPIPVSESLEYADEDMRRQHEMHRGEFESLANEYLEQPHQPRKPIQRRYDDYVEQASQQGHLLLLPEGVQMRIISKIREGDPPATSIFQCEVLDGSYRGRRIYLQRRYLTAHSDATPSA